MEKLKILMVEDLDTDVELIQHAIKKFGLNFSAMVVENEEDYIKAIGQFQPDIILSDYSLPQFNGVRALQIRQEKADSVPFIIVTGANNEIIAIECMKAGADDYIIKQHLARLGPAMDSAIIKHKLMDSEKESLEALRLSEERYKNFVSQVTEGVYRFELLSPMPLSITIEDQIDFIYHNTRLAECNEAFLKMYGANEFDELADKSFLDFHGGEENPVNRIAVKQLIDSDYKVENVITAEKNAAGELRYYSNNSIGIIKDGYLLRIWGTQKDTTEGKKAEKLLKQSEEEHRKLFQNAHDAILILDPKNEIILDANNRALDLYGFLREEFIGMSLRDITQDPKSGDEKIKQALESGYIGNFETIQFSKNRREIIFEINASIISYKGKKAILSMNHDITERKIIEETLRESEEKYRLLAENMLDMVAQHNTDGTYTYISPSMTRLLGYEIEELIGTDPYILFHPDDIDRIRNESHDYSLKGEVMNSFEYRIKKKDGRYIWFNTATKPIINAKGEIVSLQTTSHDITNRKMAEEELLKQKVFFEQMFSQSSISTQILDKDGWCERINPKLSEIFGVKPEHIEGKVYNIFKDQGIIDGGILPHLEKVYEKGETAEWEVFFDIGAAADSQNIEVKEKKKVWYSNWAYPIFNENGELSNIIIQHTDITERKIAEIALRDSEARLRTLLQTIPDLIWLKDTDGVYLSCNKMFERFFGANEAEIVGKTDYDFVNKELADFFRENDSKAILADKPTNNEEWVTFADDGHRVLLDTIKKPMHDSDGTLIGVLGIGRDITERKYAELSLMESEKRFQQVAETAEEWIWEVDESGIYRYCSSAVESILGYKPEELVGKKHFYDLFEANEREKLKEAAFNAFKERQVIKKLINVNIDKNGLKKTLETSSAPIINELGELKGYRGADMDVTERILAEEALKDSEERFRKAFQISPDSVNINRLEGGLYVNINDGFTMLTGYTKADVEGKTSLDIDIWVNQADRNKLVEGLKKNGIVRNLEARFRRKDGSVTTALMSASILNLDGVPHILSITRDIQEWKDAKNALEESEKKYRNLYNNIPVGVFKSTADGVILSLNNRMFKIYGYDSPEEFIKRPAESFYSDPSERKNILELLKKERAVINYVTEEIKKDGTKIWIKCNYAGEFNEQGELIGIEGVVEDISEQKEIEEAIRISEEKFRLLAENASDVIWTMNEKGEYLYVSPSIKRLRGYTPEEAIKQGINGAMDKNTVRMVKKELSDSVKKIMKGENPGNKTLIIELLCKNGGSVWTEITTSVVYDDEGKFVSFLGVTRDITERRKAEEEKAKLAAIVEQSTDTIVTTDLEGNITYANPYFTESSGYSVDEVLAKNPRILKSDLHDADFYKKLWNNLTLGTTWQGKFVNKKKNGNLYHEEATIFPIKNSDGEIVSYAGIKRDITDRISVEKELELHRNNLEKLVAQRTSEVDQINIQLRDEIVKGKEVEKLLRESLDKEQEVNELRTQFVSTVSHEFRTPLTTILSSVELLQRYGRKWDESKFLTHTSRVVDSIDHLSSLMDNVLLINKTETGKVEFTPTRMNLDEFCKGITSELSPLLLKNHKLIYSYDADVKEFILDEKLLRLVTLNLLSNAIKYSPDGGDINFIVSKIDKLKIVISDSGIGIDQDDITKVFDSFYRAEESSDIPGSGLGLTIVKRAVELHQGTITVDSKTGGGSKFIVELPLLGV